MHQLCYLCIVFVMLSRLYIAALWSPVGKRADLLALVCDVQLCFCHFPMWHYPGSGVFLDCIVFCYLPHFYKVNLC